MAVIGVPFQRRPKRTLRDALIEVEDPGLLEVPEALAYGRGVARHPAQTFAPEVAPESQGDPDAAELARLEGEAAEPMPASNPALDRIRQEYEEAQNPPDRRFVRNVFGGKPRGLKQWLARIGIFAAPVVAGGLLGGQEGLTGAMQGTAEALTGERQRETAHRSKLRDIMMEEENRQQRLRELVSGRRETKQYRRDTLAERIAGRKESAADRDLAREQTKTLADLTRQQTRELADAARTAPARLGDFEEAFQREHGRLPTLKDRVAYERQISESRQRPERVTPAQRGAIGQAKSAALRDRNQRLDALRKEYAERTSTIGRVAKGEMTQADLQAAQAEVEQEYQDRLALIDPEGAIAGPAKSDTGGAEMRAVPSHAPRYKPGQEVVWKGKRYRVKSVTATGQADLEPLE